MAKVPVHGSGDRFTAVGVPTEENFASVNASLEHLPPVLM
jgi:hypothetical protein